MCFLRVAIAARPENCDIGRDDNGQVLGYFLNGPVPPCDCFKFGNDLCRKALLELSCGVSANNRVSRDIGNDNGT